jgi:hypothetical protein
MTRHISLFHRLLGSAAFVAAVICLAKFLAP